MEVFFYIFIFIFWVLFWSFASVVIDRLKNKKSWIISGRSECPKCNHILNSIDLVPLFWFLINKWKCKYCKTKISYIYPILEVSMWFMFFLTTYFLIDLNKIFIFDTFEIFKIIFFLLFWFFTIVYVFYDILYLEIPDSIMIILIIMSFFWIIYSWYNNNFVLFETLKINYIFVLKDFLIFSFLIFWSILAYYFIMLKWLKEIYDLLILLIIWWIILFLQFWLNIDFTSNPIWLAILGSYLVFLFLFLQIFISGGSWMWWGDLRIWILLWMIMWFNFSFQSVMVAYIWGSIIWIILILIHKIKNYYSHVKIIKKEVMSIIWKEQNISFETKMAFWPFLAIWIYIILFFPNFIINIFSIK